MLCAALLAAACSQDEQGTPFALDPADPVSRTIDESGGTVSTPAGLSLDIPAGALGEAVEVMVTPLSGAEVGATIEGDVVPGTVFGLAPEGQRLEEPAGIGLSFEPSDFTDDELLALAVVDVVDGVPSYRDVGTLDLNAGILRADLRRLGTVGVRVAPMLAVQSGDPRDVASGGPLFLTAPAAVQALRPWAEDRVTYTVSCGPDTSSCVGPDGPVRAYVSPNLVERFAGRLGAIGASIEASLSFDGASSTVEGQIRVDGVLRVRAGLSVTSKEVGYDIVTGTLGGEEPVPTEFEVDGTTLTLSQTPDGPVVLQYTATPDHLELVLPETTIELETTGGGVEQGKVWVVITMTRAS
ncbi:MAG TPA: hypothetical protein VF188_09955 [Longimicrobiales bacterium]